ncbi:Frag1/DRAM/Sfk1 family-domain-containing protein [Mycena pura]|uniref:Frag1/DRAM/Sfk1 family-domain-containing protein n=1 Tax=Mycena pura TaxID=153505 RepID=A0AAD6VRG5_9AGAR|nr:Frag1/DRAM/Sfk1 family-domain-containing protein [Mycena pura]
MTQWAFPSTYVARTHTVLSSSAFIVALIIGLLYHYKKIVKNAVAQYPDEWWPSVSATIGDWYPERNLFQFLIALTSGPRLGLVFVQYLLHSNSKISVFIFISGLIRTLCCGGWVYVTSSDDHEVHDFFMISYMVCNIPWMLGCVVLAPAQTRRRRLTVASGFFLSLIPLIYYYIQHQVHRIPGAYTRYSFFEWSLIVFDVLFDSIAEDELRSANLQIFVGKNLIAAQASVNEKSETGATKTIVESAAVLKNPTKITTVDELVSKENANFSSRFSFMRQIASWKPAISFVSSVYLSYIFWSIFTSLIPTLFYFSVWELGISGHELALLSVLSPFFLSMAPVQSWAKSRDGATTLRALSLLGLAAFVLDKPVHRLAVVFFASATAMMAEAVNWAVADAEYSREIVTGLGFLLSSLSKHANHSNNPVWPFVNSNSGGYNKTGIILAALAIYEHHSREPLALSTQLTPKKATDPSDSATSSHWLSAAIPLGSLIFTLHSLLSDPGTLIAWSWTGYLNSQPQGPLPHLHGSLTIIAQSIGLLLAFALISRSSIDVLAHPFWFAYGSVATAVLYSSRNWYGYIGGLNLAIFVTSIIPVVLKRASTAAGSEGKHTGRVYFTAMLVYCLLGLASIWTVAYAFVPGGVYLRERTDLVLILQMACLSLAFEWPGLKSRASQRKTAVSPAFLSCTPVTLACFSVASLLVTMYRTPTGFPQPFKPGPRIFNAGIWTVHFGMDNEGRDSQRLVRDVVRDMELDVLGLLETDLHRIVFGNRDLTRVLVEEIGYYVDVGPGAASHTWGAVLLSKFPIVNSTHHLLPSPHGELAPAIEAVLDVFGTYVTVVVAHNGQEEDPLDRELQSTELARIMAASYPRPVLFLGYVVTKPHAQRPAPYEILVQDGRVHDIDQDDLDRWCEYIFYRGMYRTSYARISRGKVTDTELQIGQFALPPHGSSVVDESKEARYLRSYKEDLPEDHWFPMSYYEPGRHNHFYHVFGTPLYYKIPKDPQIQSL